MNTIQKSIGRIIGVCGLNASDQGYGILSLSDALRRELKQRSIPETRDNLISMGNELRNKYGAGILASMILKNLDLNSNYVIDSIRHPDEVKELRAGQHQFCLVGVDCLPSVRYQRLVSRARVGETGPLEYEEFLKIDQRESNNPDPKGQQVASVLKSSDILIDNNQDLDHFKSQLNSLNQQIDQYFQNNNNNKSLVNVNAKKKNESVFDILYLERNSKTKNIEYLVDRNQIIYISLQKKKNYYLDINYNTNQSINESINLKSIKSNHNHY
ncbi:hypothetical protein PPL_00242 [Heterostelium album PN500]|uniref:Uncharacterized protein n=1 Tax=Heterostelium pallidum (strain ATCC 26659 / Pp 5 / PN500) TaxID=670386 RepID=D3AVX6_HETP5|nr:hypothetical protein PPL_00242 [Heterostelium album PN500]EFA86449.1 hypothetical protein PPL_00242 [Heterostelium album PN500]|eukprot:XP_020438554.1 hypothetical protein PPL_00242 [Heterostelium album PN500]